MIPKIIHYCWFGQNEKSEVILRCIESWKRKLPDYEIIEWNESNFDVAFCSFAKTAYDAKKYAFVSDVARLKIIHDYGGIYMDTDVELLEDPLFSNYLQYDAFFFVGLNAINTGSGFGGKQGSIVIKELLNSYEGVYFDPHDMKKFICPNFNSPVIRTMFPQLHMDNTTQILDNHAFIAEHVYYSFARHYGSASWCDDEYFKLMAYARKEHKVSKFRLMIINAKIWSILEKYNLSKIKNVLLFMVCDLVDYGLIYWLVKVKRKIFR